MLPGPAAIPSQYCLHSQLYLITRLPDLSLPSLNTPISFSPLDSFVPSSPFSWSVWHLSFFGFTISPFSLLIFLSNPFITTQIWFLFSFFYERKSSAVVVLKFFCLRTNPGFTLLDSCLTLGKPLMLSKSQFSHLQMNKWQSNRTYAVSF